MHCYPVACYLVPRGTKYLPHYPILKDLQPMFLPCCERRSFTPIKNNRQMEIVNTKACGMCVCVVNLQRLTSCVNPEISAQGRGC